MQCIYVYCVVIKMNNISTISTECLSWRCYKWKLQLHEQKSAAVIETRYNFGSSFPVTMTFLNLRCMTFYIQFLMQMEHCSTDMPTVDILPSGWKNIYSFNGTTFPFSSVTGYGQPMKTIYLWLFLTSIWKVQKFQLTMYQQDFRSVRRVEFLCHFSWKNAWNNLSGNVKDCHYWDQTATPRQLFDWIF